MSDTTSHSLLGRILATRDEAAWQQFSAIYVPLLKGWLARHGVAAADADDVQQDVMMVLLRELPGFMHNGRPGAFRAWIRRILANRLTLFYRQRQKDKRLVEQAMLDLGDSLEHDDSPLTAAWDREHNSLVLERMLEILSAEFTATSMTAFRRIVLEEQDPDLVAQELGISLNAARIAKSRILASLRGMAGEILD